MDQFFSKYQGGFRKGYSTRYCLLAMLEKWKSAVDKENSFGVLSTDLPKEFGCLSYKLPLTKRHAYGFSTEALRPTYSYLTDRWQSTKINMLCISLGEIVFGAPQGSILVPLLFSIFPCELFFVMKETDVSSYADDDTPYRSHY